MSTRGPSAVVIGSTTGTSNFQRDPFGAPLPTTGLESNFYGYRNTITLAPGQTKSLLRYVVAGRTETATTIGAQSTVVTTERDGPVDRARPRRPVRGRAVHRHELHARGPGLREHAAPRAPAASRRRA